MIGCDADCCYSLAGDVYVGPPMLCDGSGYANEAFGWGDEWGNYWGGFSYPSSVAGGIGLPPARPLGNAQVAYTPNYRELTPPVYYGLRTPNCGNNKVIESVGVTLRILCTNRKNVQRSMFATSVTACAGQVTTEPLQGRGVLPAGTLIPFAQAPYDSSLPFQVQVYNPITNAVVGSLIPDVDFKHSMFGIVLTRTLVLNEPTHLVATYVSLSTEVQDSFTTVASLDVSLMIESASHGAKPLYGQKYKGQVGWFFPRLKLYPSGTTDILQTSDTLTFTLEGTAVPVSINGRDVRLRTYWPNA